MSDAIATVLADAARGGRPDSIMLMRLLSQAATEDEARSGLAEAIASRAASSDHAGVARLEGLHRLWTAHPQAWSVVRSTLAVAAHDRPNDAPADALRHWADVFDRLAAAAPEAGVALYSLGSAALLKAATEEIVAYLDRLSLLHPASDVLDVGCGIGRLAITLAPHVKAIVGVDIAAGMIAEARRRCGDLPNVTFRHADGRDLAFAATSSVDLVLALDVFPYLVQVGGGLASGHVHEVARVLRPGGAALILNFSYRGDLNEDRRDVAAACDGAGLNIVRNGCADLTLWDAVTFLLVKPD